MWARMRDSLWFAPGVGTVAGAVAAAASVHFPPPGATLPVIGGLLFAGGGESARGILTAIATSLITVTGVVFSVTIVTLQLASSQFTPRVIRRFVAERSNQIVLAIFIGTFTYTLLVLGSIGSGADTGTAPVPRVAVSLALILLLVSVGALIFFIHHSAYSVQAAVIIYKESRETLAQLDRLFPERAGARQAGPQVDPLPPRGELFEVCATCSGYLQAIEADALFDLAERHDLVIRMERHIGEFLLEGKPLASVWPEVRARPMERELRDSFILGIERTRDQDVEFGLLVVSEVAVRALSPGINDPSTAIVCLDRQAEVLAALDRRCPPSVVRVGRGGAPRIFARTISFERAAGYAFDSIRHYGASHPGVLKRMLEILRELYVVSSEPARLILSRHAEVALRTIRSNNPPGADLDVILRVWTGVEEAAREPAEMITDSAGTGTAPG